MFADLILGFFKFVLYTLLLITSVGAFIYFLRRERPLIEYTKSHWHSTFDNLQGTAFEIYGAIEKAVHERKIPGVVTKIVTWKEGGVFSDSRKYLRVRRGELSYDVCVAPCGGTIFVSCWLTEKPSTFLDFLATLPGISWFVVIGQRLFFPLTYYKIDSELVFEGAVHACVIGTLEQMLSAQGLDPIPENERKPVMRDLYGRKRQPA